MIKKLFILLIVLIIFIFLMSIIVKDRQNRELNRDSEKEKLRTEQLKKGSNKNEINGEVFVTIWKLNTPNPGDSTIFYSGYTPIKTRLDFLNRITPECDGLIGIKNSNWDHQVILRGCGRDGTTHLPKYYRGSVFTIEKLKR